MPPDLSSYISSSLKGNPDKNGINKNTSKQHSQAPELSYTVDLNSGPHAQLHKIWLISAQNVKVAISAYVFSLQNIVTARDNHEISQMVIKAGEVLKRSMDDIINIQTGYAISVISNFEPHQQKPAMIYWESLTSQLHDYFNASIDSCRDSTKHLTEITSKLWAAQEKMADDAKKVYDNRILNVK